MSELRLLIVDDDEADRLAIRRAVNAWDSGAVIEEMRDAKSLAETLARGQFDCVVLDHALPGESTVDVVRRLREAGIQVPILAVTGADDTLGSQIVAAGATDFLPKSDLESGRLIRRIRHAVRLGRAERAVERAGRVREEILEIVSHDLLNPLNSIGIAVEQLADPDIDAAGRQKYADAIRRSLGRADRLIRDLLDATIIETGRLRIEPRPVSVRPLLEQVVRDHELQAQQANTSLHLEVGAGVEKVRADRDRAVQVLANLLGNAFRYGPGGEGILIAAEPEGDRVRFSVRDSGPGIPADVLPYIFDRYYQGNRARRAGAGLGLAIAKGIVEAHGGVIGVENDSKGGARFWFTLPAS